VAQWLELHPKVLRVLYPALASDPGHAIWQRDFEGAASLFGVILQPYSRAQVTTLVNGLALFGIGSSWGGYESLITAPNPETIRTAKPWQPGGPILRLHIGLEDPSDLIADLEQALSTL
jgi:cystathionine beta-lyase